MYLKFIKLSHCRERGREGEGEGEGEGERGREREAILLNILELLIYFLNKIP